MHRSQHMIMQLGGASRGCPMHRCVQDTKMHGSCVHAWLHSNKHAALAAIHASFPYFHMQPVLETSHSTHGRALGLRNETSDIPGKCSSMQAHAQVCKVNCCMWAILPACLPCDVALRASLVQSLCKHAWHMMLGAMHMQHPWCLKICMSSAVHAHAAFHPSY